MELGGLDGRHVDTVVVLGSGTHGDLFSAGGLPDWAGGAVVGGAGHDTGLLPADEEKGLT